MFGREKHSIRIMMSDIGSSERVEIEVVASKIDMKLTEKTHYQELSSHESSDRGLA